MSDTTSEQDDELEFPQRFMEESFELGARTDDGEAWAKFMYGDWFVCPTSRISSVLRISICRRGHYVPLSSTDCTDRLDVLADTPTLCESSGEYGFQLPHISLRDLVLESLEQFEDENGSILDIDKKDAARLVDDIEATVMSAIEELRARIK